MKKLIFSYYKIREGTLARKNGETFLLPECVLCLMKYSVKKQEEREKESNEKNE